MRLTKFLAAVAALMIALSGLPVFAQYNGTAVGTPTYSATGAKFGQAVTMSSGNYIGILSASTTGNFERLTQTGSFRWEGWFSIASSQCTATRVLHAFAYASGGNAGWIGTNSSGYITATMGGTSFPVITGTSSVCTASLHHVRWEIASGATEYIYIDGTLAASGTGALVATNAAALTSAYGSLTGGFYWPGILDEAALFSNAIVGTFTPPSSAYVGNEFGLLDLYHLDGNANDSSQNLNLSFAVTNLTRPNVVGTWQAPTGGTSPYTYQMQRAPDAGGVPGTYANVGSSTSSLTATDATDLANTLYWYRVQITDAASVVTDSAPTTVTTQTGGFNLVATGSPIYTTGGFTTSLATSSGNYLSAASATPWAIPAGSANWCATSYASTSSTGQTSVIMGTINTTTGSWWFGNTSTGYPEASIQGFANIIASSSYANGSSHYYEASISGNTLYFFVDGALIGSAVGTIPTPGSTLTAYIGYYGGFPWTGKIYDAAVWGSGGAGCHTAAYTVPSSAYVGTEGMTSFYPLTASPYDFSTSLYLGQTVAYWASTSVNLTWPTAVYGTAPYSYQPQYTTTPLTSASWTNIGSATTGASATVSGLSANTLYYFRLNVTDSSSTPVTKASSYVSQLTLQSTMHYNASNAVDYVTADPLLVLVPNSLSSVPYTGAATPLCMYFHGAGQIQTNLITDPNWIANTGALSDVGCIAVGVYANGDQWGTQTGCDTYVAAYNYMVANYNINYVLGISLSMGGLCGATEILQGKIPNIIAWYYFFPVQNLYQMWNSPGSVNYSTYIAGQYGFTGVGNSTFANIAAPMDPHTKSCAGLTRGGTIRENWIYPTGDTIVAPATNVLLAHTLVSGCAIENTLFTCTGNHGDPSCFSTSAVPSVNPVTALFQRALANPPPTVGKLGVGPGNTVSFGVSARAQTAVNIGMITMNGSTQSLPAITGMANGVRLCANRDNGLPVTVTSSSHSLPLTPGNCALFPVTSSSVLTLTSSSTTDVVTYAAN